jgi:fumarylacetoacetase
MTQLLTSFLEIDPHSDFTIHNLPYGIFSEVPNGHKRVGVAIGEWVLDLAFLESEGLLNIDGNIDLQDILMHKSQCCGLDLNNLIIEQN